MPARALLGASVPCREACVKTGLAATLNHHFWSSLCVNTIRFHSSYSTVDQRNAPGVCKCHSNISTNNRLSSLPHLLPLFHSSSVFSLLRVKDVGVRRLRVARGLFYVSQLREADRRRGLHPGQQQLLLRAVLRGQGGSSVQPLQQGLENVSSLSISP